ncbi:DUF6976 family protein [Pelagicoccus albus]|uniref:Uncharacterized protein n=1 Tax=Pelagicoccus albus TaxID=415222 RepID=A0A7X1E922_9BACT|nr:hypothetical protein [Pelagicoccus albus]MBC2607355.1 hypothetical protein [Pelagicoccus albus]
MKNVLSNTLVSLEEAKDLIRKGEPLSVAGSEELLAQLPAGNWIGGTSSYFMAEGGGVLSSDQVFVSHLPEGAGICFKTYEADQLHDIMDDAPDNGFSMVIIPSGSGALRQFSEGSRYWEDILLKPVVGWVSGINLADLGKAVPKVFLGTDASAHDNVAVVAHVSLPAHQLALVETVNIFERDESCVIRFDERGTEVVDCVVDGQRMKFIDFLKSKGNEDGKLPIIGNFSGANINVSIQSVDEESGKVTFYAPVFQDVEYSLAKDIADYSARFTSELDNCDSTGLVSSCNCILNYLHGELEGKKAGELQGPITFGEIAYLLHNQTLVTLRVL